MAVRKIVQIDEDKCNGCGLCIPNCVEGALKIIDGKAKLVKDIYCDGLGACLGHCPQDAIQIIEREAANFDLEEAEKNMKQTSENIVKPEAGCPGSTARVLKSHEETHEGGCPGSRMRIMQQKSTEEDGADIKMSSKLRQWPVQLTLVSPSAPYFKNADLLITADCVPFAYANYHNDFLRNKTVVVGCPKLDDVQSYIDKLEDIIKANDLESITVLRMEVPCCGGMTQAAKTARDRSGIDIPIKVVVISINGEILKKEYV